MSSLQHILCDPTPFKSMASFSLIIILMCICKPKYTQITPVESVYQCLNAFRADHLVWYNQFRGSSLGKIQFLLSSHWLCVICCLWWEPPESIQFHISMPIAVVIVYGLFRELYSSIMVSCQFPLQDIVSQPTSLFSDF